MNIKLLVMKMRICHFRMQSYKIIRHKPSACKEKVEKYHW